MLGFMGIYILPEYVELCRFQGLGFWVLGFQAVEQLYTKYSPIMPWVDAEIQRSHILGTA